MTYEIALQKGFEPSCPYGPTDFETVAISLSATAAYMFIITEKHMIFKYIFI